MIRYENGEAVLAGLDGYGMVAYSDGYLGYSEDKSWVRHTFDVFLYEQFYVDWQGYHNEMEVSKEELEVRKKYFSNTEAPKYAL